MSNKDDSALGPGLPALFAVRRLLAHAVRPPAMLLSSDALVPWFDISASPQAGRGTVGVDRLLCVRPYAKTSSGTGS